MATDILTDAQGTPNADITHFVFADGTGHTAEEWLKAGRYQFDKRADIVCIPEIRTEADLQVAFNQVRAHTSTPVGIIATSFVINAREEFERAVENFANERNARYFSFMGQLLTVSEELHGKKPKGIPGFMDAVRFAKEHDDGRGDPATLRHARISLAGISRVGKTVFCDHLAATFGLRATNCPFTIRYKILPQFMNLPDTCHIALRKDAELIATAREERAREGNYDEETKRTYLSINKIEEEQMAFEIFAEEHKWPILDISKLAIEEAAKKAIRHLNRFSRPKGLRTIPLSYD